MNSPSVFANHGTMPQRIVTSSRSPVFTAAPDDGLRISWRNVIVRRNQLGIAAYPPYVEMLGDLLLIEEAVVATAHALFL